MPPQRLPIVNSDDAVWGNILIQYLKLEHWDDGTNNPGSGGVNANGGHHNVTLRAGGDGVSTNPGAPLRFNDSAGTVLATPLPGAVEFSNNALYLTVTGPTRKKVAIYDDSSGATGDIYYRDSGGNFTRLASGATGTLLKSTGAGAAPAWSNTAPVLATASKTSNWTIAPATDYVIFADATSGSIIITLPLAAGANTGYKFYIKRIDGSGNTVTIARSGSDTIDGQASQTLDLQYTAIAVVSNGANWFIL